jgi:hypothetical protein
LSMRNTKDCSIPRRAGLLPVLISSSVAVVSSAPSTLCAEELSDDWQFGVAIYGWLPDIGGHTNLPIGSSIIDIDVSTILDHLKMAGMGTFQVQKDRWGAFTDVVYLDVGDSKSQTRQLEIGGDPLPSGVTANANFDLQTVIWTLAGSYRVIASEAGTFDILLGTRFASLKQQLDWEFIGAFGSITPPPRTGIREESVDLWDGIVGVKGQFGLGAKKKWMVPCYVDVGTGDSDMTWQARVGLGYAFRWGDVAVVWRYLDYDLKSSRAIEDMNFNGPAIGANFRW